MLPDILEARRGRASTSHSAPVVWLLAVKLDMEFGSLRTRRPCYVKQAYAHARLRSAYLLCLSLNRATYSTIKVSMAVLSGTVVMFGGIYSKFGCLFTLSVLKENLYSGKASQHLIRHRRKWRFWSSSAHITHHVQALLTQRV